IRIDGRNIAEINSESLYKKIAFVQKNDFLVEGNVSDNIKLDGSLNLTDKLKDSLGFDETFLNKKLFRVQSLISEGEKQRIDLARFLNRRYSIYIFD
ncbi:TPA: ABC transporter ATP-binding protein, partial [Streptococcus equi subsp. equi]|nr:ABC transporter ATP-binding protein [Streptococcus equi subsp. equi]